MNIRKLKKITPTFIRNARHFFYAWWGAIKYNHPSEEILVIGVTGTSGKSTTITLLRQLLEKSGHIVGSLSTIDFYVAGEKKLNDKKMTMLGKMEIQKYLREMVDQKCTVAIIETTSEGRLQHRHRFINYDIMVLTNMYPEHIESHGSMKKYVQAKLDLFSYASHIKRKILQSKKMEKIAIVNGNTEYSSRFLRFSFDKKFLFGTEDKKIANKHYSKKAIIAKDINVSKTGLEFTIHELGFHPAMFGEYNISNIAGVVAVARALDIPWSTIQEAVDLFHNVDGRIEFIPEAASIGIQVIVDYAFEPGAMEELYKVVDLLAPKRVIHVFGSTGGGRDVERRFSVGTFVGKHADICIVTDEDPYDDDPKQIIDDVAGAVEKTGKKKNKSLFTFLDRKEAIQKAITMATSGDLVLVTGKGSEQAMVVKGELIPWDDRNIVRNVLEQL